MRARCSKRARKRAAYTGHSSKRARKRAAYTGHSSKRARERAAYTITLPPAIMSTGSEGEISGRP